MRTILSVVLALLVLLVCIKSTTLKKTVDNIEKHNRQLEQLINY